MSEAKLAQALHWRAVERELRSRGWSRSRAVAEVARLRRALEVRKSADLATERPAGLLARLLARFR
jgi:hypothetical protein